MKRKFNWLRWFLIALYLLPSIITFVIAGKSTYQLGLCFISCIWFLIALLLIKITNKKIWMIALSLKTEQATMTFKSTLKEDLYDGSGGSSAFHNKYLVFELKDGSRKVFNLAEKDSFYTIIPRDTGTLSYKEHKNKLFFIDFIRENSSDCETQQTTDANTTAEKKYYNWVGWILSSLYLCLFIFLTSKVFVDYFSNSSYIVIDFILSVSWLVIALCILPLTLNKTWYKCLPIKKATAKLIFSSEFEKIYTNNGFASSEEKYLVFEFPDGSRKHFKADTLTVKEDSINSQFLLTYKEYKKRIFLINFEKI